MLRRYCWLMLAVFLAGCGSATTQPLATVASKTTTQGAATAASVPPAAAAPQACPSAVGPLTAPIIFGRAGNLMEIQTNGQAMQAITKLPVDWTASDPAWSPDNQTLAFTLTQPPVDPQVSYLPTSSICGLDRATGRGRPLAHAGLPGASLLEPSWTPDGQSLLVTRREPQFNQLKQYEGDRVNVIRYTLAPGKETLLIPNAKQALLSPDGNRLLYIENNLDTNVVRMMLAQPDGQAAQPVKLPSFATINSPAWSPNGQSIVYSAVDAALSRAPTRRWWEHVLGIKVVAAHGNPADLWVVDIVPQTGRRLTNLALDDPRSAWSPDGEHIAFTAGTNGGVYVVPVGGGQEQALTDQGDYGGIAWSSR